MKKVENFIIYLTSSIRTASYFEKGSKTFDTHIQHLWNSINQFFKEQGSLKIKISSYYIFVNENRFNISIGIIGAYRMLINELLGRGISGVTFNQDVSVNDIKEFIFIIGRSRLSSKSYEEIERLIEKRGIKGIEIERKGDEEITTEGAGSLRRAAIAGFLNSIFYLKDAMENVRLGRSINVTRARKIIRNFIDMVTQDEFFVIGLTTIKNIGSYTLNHSVNVCVLSIAVGLKLGLNRRDIAELGIAGLFHDIGKVDIPDEIIEKPEPLTEEEFEQIKKHPYLGAERVILLKGMKNIPAFAVRGILEHHIDYNGKGYPEINIDKPSLFARIIRVVDTYDAMTTPRVYQKKPYTPENALKYIISKKGEVFDPIVVDAFVEMMGVYPPGSVVELDTGEIGIVISPTTVVIIDKHGKEISRTEDIYRIVRALTPEEAGIDPSIVYFALGTGPEED
ncbi:HD-GYP domain-containing protein [candidate division WOR-3 bacterium]|nr:HD-GYP domain-containing protein [candidate division WOR-3 bacterium]